MEDKLIPRDKVTVTLTLSTGINISGVIQIDVGSRLSDFMNYPERFIIIRDKNETLRLVNKDHIVEINLK